MKLRKESVRKKLTGFAAALGMLLQSVSGYTVYASEEMPGLQAEAIQHGEIKNETEPADDAGRDEDESGQVVGTDTGADEEEMRSDAEGSSGEMSEDAFGEKNGDEEDGGQTEDCPEKESNQEYSPAADDKKPDESDSTERDTDNAGIFDRGQFICRIRSGRRAMSWQVSRKCHPGSRGCIRIERSVLPIR